MSSQNTIHTSSDQLSVSEKTKGRLYFRPDIEGLRGIAIILIVGYHAGISGFKGGYIGVDIFFVLSGYLITWLLVHEAEEKGTINLLKFYARRVRRLLPAVAVMLFVTVLLSALLFAPYEQRPIANSAIATSAYMSNVYFSRAAVDYLGARIDTNPLLHTWSLAVEEQFYLFWPLFVMYSLGVLRWQKRILNSRNIIVWMGIIAIISLFLSIYFTHENQPSAFFLLPTRAWEFAVGALGLLVPSNFWLSKKKFSEGAEGSIEPSAKEYHILSPIILGWVGLFGILFSVFTFDENTVFPGVIALIPALSTMIVLRVGSLGIKKGIEKVLGFPLMQLFGRLSYSWYFWHWPIFVFATIALNELSLPVRISLILFSLILAEISFRFVENPIRKNQWLIQRPYYSLGLAVVITVLGIGLSFAWRQLSINWSESPTQVLYTNARNDIPVIYTNGCHLDFYSVDLNINDCATGIKNSVRKIILFGDSHAAQWYPALEKIADNEGWQLIPLTKSSCPFVDLPTINTSLRREYSECDIWRKEVLQKIREIKPFLVVMSMLDSYSFSNDELFMGTNDILGEISHMSQYVVIIRDTPHIGFDVPTYLARRAWSSKFGWDLPYEDVSRENLSLEIYNLQKQAAGNYDNVSVIDMMPYICPSLPCLLEQNGLPIYRDSHHITQAFSASLTPILTEQFELILQK